MSTKYDLVGTCTDANGGTGTAKLALQVFTRPTCKVEQISPPPGTELNSGDKVTVKVSGTVDPDITAPMRLGLVAGGTAVQLAADGTAVVTVP